MIEGETPPIPTIFIGFVFHAQSGTSYLSSVVPPLGQDVRDGVECVQEARRAGAVLHIYSGLCVLVFIIEPFKLTYHIRMDEFVIAIVIGSQFRDSSS